MKRKRERESYVKLLTRAPRTYLLLFFFLSSSPSFDIALPAEKVEVEEETGADKHWCSQ